MQAVPILDAPSQIVKASLGGQAVRLALRTLGAALYCDVYVADALIIGFPGDLMFVDNLGNSDPASPGLGSRFSLVYLTPGDLSA